MTSRRYPKFPIPGVGGIVVGPEGILLVVRDKEPAKGRLSLPGGGVDVGETQEQAVVREVREETGIDCEVIKFVTTADLIMPDDEGSIEFHFILNHYLCKALSFELRAESPDAQPMWIEPSRLREFDIPPRVFELLMDNLNDIALIMAQ
ncbi:MAG: NUDIX hydrolase [Candidatus Thorarchaeota archaeon]